MLKEIINKFTRKPRTLFLIDGIGAIISAFSLGVLLVRFESTFGMPKEVLYYLALIACVFAMYSLTCYARLKENFGFYLKFIAYANLTYCLIQIFLVYYHFDQLTGLGVTYFVIELLIVSGLIGIELNTANTLNLTNDQKLH